MISRTLTLFVVFALPFLAYWVWQQWRVKQGLVRDPWPSTILILTALVMAVEVGLLAGATAKGHRGDGRWIPAHLDKAGDLEPGRWEPAEPERKP
jgi:hypothetical protein